MNTIVSLEGKILIHRADLHLERTLNKVHYYGLVAWESFR
jgi:hypothetical protein